jgi:hypothetical protein
MISEHDDDPFAAGAQQIQAMPDQSSADAAALKFGQHGYRSQCRGRNRAAGCFDEHTAE